MEMSPEQVADYVGGTIGEWDIMSVKREAVLLPPTTNVPVKILEVKQINQSKEGATLDWKMIIVKFQLTSGIDVGGETKYKGSIVESNLICYSASDTKYDYAKPFFGKQQFLVEFASLCRAVDTRLPIGMTGAKDEDVAAWIDEVTNKRLLINVNQTAVQFKDPESGKYVEKVPTELKNIAVSFKKLPEEMMV